MCGRLQNRAIRDEIVAAPPKGHRMNAIMK
jgi:hypothetical protein